jgi:hypothetical protein
MQNVILHTNSILTTTTTKMLHSIFVCNPPKRISNFENNFLAGIVSNTLQAGYKLEPILLFLLGFGPNLDLSAPWSIPLTSPHQLHHLHWPGLD